MKSSTNHNNLIAIGYWKSDSEPNLPHPKDFQDENWDVEEKRKVINHLKNARVARRYRGYSWCRFECGEATWNMGSKCLTDGTYIFPEKLIHYVEKHNIRLPIEFIDHVKNYEPVEEGFWEDIDFSWWEAILQ